MFLAFMGNHALDFLGIVFIVTTAVKITMGKPVNRWFW